MEAISPNALASLDWKRTAGRIRDSKERQLRERRNLNKERKIKKLILLLIFFFISCFSVCQSCTQDTLPDNYLKFTLHIQNGRLEGSSEHLEGFKISMDIPNKFLKNGLNGLDIKTLISLVKNQEIIGTLTYPNGRKTQIKYEVVRHRGTEDIYMKTTLGYFLWEMLNIQDDKVIFAIYWWYCPPARKVDLEILEMTEQLFADSANWHQNDDRKCDDDIESNHWSLFCALKHASIEKMGEYNHHNTAMQTVRFVIDDIIPDHGFEHTLMDYNNASSTKHGDILRILEIAKERIKKEIKP